MSDLNTIKIRLKNIQSNFNPEKETYKIINSVTNEELSSMETLKRLSAIRGINKYPENIKNEYISIINDLKELILEEKRQEEKKKEENTKELKNIIASLEQKKDEQLEVLEENKIEEPNNVEQKEIQTEEKKEEPKKEEQKSKDTELNEDDQTKGKGKFAALLISLIISIVIIILILLFY